MYDVTCAVFIDNELIFIGSDEQCSLVAEILDNNTHERFTVSMQYPKEQEYYLNVLNNKDLLNKLLSRYVLKSL